MGQEAGEGPAVLLAADQGSGCQLSSLTRDLRKDRDESPLFCLFVALMLVIRLRQRSLIKRRAH